MSTGSVCMTIISTLAATHSWRSGCSSSSSSGFAWASPIRRSWKEVQTYAKKCLIPLQKEGSNPPLFLVHEMSGGLLAYRHLVKCLGKRRKVYGLQYPGQNENATSAMSIPEMAAIYVDAIRAAWPDGPYYVGGYSLGGQVAFETACQLSAAGGDVRLLALIDGPTHDAKVRGLRKIARKTSRFFAGLSDEHLENWPSLILGMVSRKQRRLREPQPAYQQNGTPQSFAGLLLRQAGAYAPSVYGGPTKVLRCTQGDGYWNKRLLGWDRYTSGPVEVVDIPADHLSISTDPVVALVAAHLERWMREAENT